MTQLSTHRSVEELKAVVAQLVEEMEGLTVAQHVGKVLDLLEEFKREVAALAAGGLCDYELAYVHYRLAQHTIAVTIPASPEFAVISTLLRGIIRDATRLIVKFGPQFELVQRLLTNADISTRLARLKVGSVESDVAALPLPGRVALGSAGMPRSMLPGRSTTVTLRMLLPAPALTPAQYFPTFVLSLPHLAMGSPTITPAQLHHCLQVFLSAVLIIDTRNRYQYSLARVAAALSVCVEPLSIQLSSDDNQLAHALLLLPTVEKQAYARRFEVHLVVLVGPEHPLAEEHRWHDKLASMLTAPSASPATASQMLRHPPVLLQGGFELWRQQFPNAVATGGVPEIVEETVSPTLSFLSPTLFHLEQHPTTPVQLPATPRVSYPDTPLPPRRPAPLSTPPVVLHMPYNAGLWPPPAPSPAASPKPAVDIGQLLKTFTTGLQNLGNLCYMNCIIQCLSGAPSFLEFFISGAFKNHINAGNRLGSGGVVLTAFRDLERRMVANDGRWISPAAFKKLIGALNLEFALGCQQDCIEFCDFLLDKIHEDLNTAKRSQANGFLELSPAEEAARELLPVRLASTIEWERYLKLNFSIVVDYFQGQYLSQLQCTVCHTTSTTYNAFLILSLPIPARTALNRNVTLQQCLDLFCAPEVLDGDDRWNCPHCKVAQRATKRLLVTRLPNVLVVHFKRFKMDQHMSKLDEMIEYPVDLVLDLTLYWARPQSRDEIARLQQMPERNQKPPFCYQLFGVANHFGTLLSGHYTAFVRHEGKGWCLFDDTVVKANVGLAKVLNKNAYCLFYKRV